MADLPKSSRRKFLGAVTAALGGAAAAPIASVAAEVLPLGPADAAPVADDPDAALYQLGHELLCATVGYNDEKPDEEFEAQFCSAASIVERIIATPARGLGGLRVKILALRWCYCFEPVDLLKALGQTTDVRMLDSVVRDLTDV